VGSGPGGGVLAVELLKKGVNVALLEQGGDYRNSDFSQTVDKFNIEGDMDVSFGHSRQVGGSSNLWAGRVSKLEERDLNSRSSEGWPIEYSELERFYDQALKILNLSNNNKKKNLNAFGLDSKKLNTKEFKWSLPPFNVKNYIFNNKSIFKGELTIYTHAKVVSLNEDDLLNQINSLNVISPKGEKIKVYSDTFVLAAGGIETPRILLNSKTKNKKGIGNDNDNVGRYFSTHPKVDIGFLRTKKWLSTKNSVFTNRKIGNEFFRHGIGVNENLCELNHYIQISSALESEFDYFFESMKKIPYAKFLSKKNIRIVDRLGLMVLNIFGKLSYLQPFARSFKLRIFLDQIPSRSNRVLLSKALDKTGVNKVDIHWSFSNKDKKTLFKFVETINKEFIRGDFGLIKSDILKEKKLKLTAIHSHFMGTTRMSNVEKFGVVNQDCRVFNYSNLYISGPSVFPTYGFANPFLTIVALSIRLAEHITNNKRLM